MLAMPPSNLTLRKAEPADARSIEALYRQLVSNPSVSVLPERIAQIGQDPNTALFVCVAEGCVRGTALVSLCADAMFQFQPFAVVENVVVDSDRRSAGIGTALLRHVEAFCRQADCSKIMLLSSSGREPAHRFFERMGFAGSVKKGFVKYRRQFEVQT